MSDAPIAHTALGDLQGTWHNGVAAFLGVPYAEPPLRAQRFLPPLPVRPWSGLLDASRHGPIAPQLPSRLAAAMGQFSRPQDEDCLTLSIYTPAPDDRRRPVVVWLHGGAWISGAGSLDWYDGSLLSHHGDIVFVGVNYRLGALGWLHRSGLVDADAGIADMMAALLWVRQNIAGFGGDPDTVTVMGQSAGATSIGRLLMIPEASRLFQRVIMQSGGFGRGAYTEAAATAKADAFMRLLDIDPQSADALARLQSVDVPRLLHAQGELARSGARFPETTPPFMPVMPGSMTQADMLAAVADGAQGKDVLIGATSDEVHAFFAADPSMQNLPVDAVNNRFGDAAAVARFRARRPGASAMDLLADLGTYETFVGPSMRLAEAIATRGDRVFAYRFDWAPPASRFKSCHCIELPFVFGNFPAWADAAMLAGGDAQQLADLSVAMHRAWIAFIRTGHPDHEMLPAWPGHDPARRQTMCFGARIGVAGDPGGFAAGA